MRVAYCLRAVFPQHGYGGLERSGTDLMRHLLGQGVNVDLFTRPLTEGQPIQPDGERGRLFVHAVEYGKLPLRPNGIPARLTNYRSFVETAGRRVRGLASRGIVQAVYAHGLFAWGVRNAAEWGVPMVANPHGLEEFKSLDPLKRLAYAPFRAWVRAGCRAADRIIATDSSMRSEVARLLGLPEKRVVVIRNGIDLAQIHAWSDPVVKAELKSRFLLPERSEALLGISVGRLEANKGFDLLLRALSAARTQLGERWAWVLVGEGSLRRELEQTASELGIEDQIAFAGRLTDEELHNLYEVCNLFVHPTLYEGSSLVTLEAMAHGLPVIASTVGGIPDKVADGQNGFLVPPGNIEALVDRIAWTATHSEELKGMGEEGARLAAQFDWPKIAKQTRNLLGALVAERAACGAEVASRPR